MIVGAVAIVGPVRPRPGLEAFGAEPGGQIGSPVRPVGVHATETPMAEPTANVTPAAAAPMRTWRAPEKRTLRPVSRLTAAPTAKSAPRLSSRLATKAGAPDVTRYARTGTAAPTAN